MMDILNDLQDKIKLIQQDIDLSNKKYNNILDENDDLKYRIRKLEDLVMGQNKPKKRNRGYNDIFVKVCYNDGDITEERLRDAFSFYDQEFQIVMVADNKKFAQISFNNEKDKEFCLLENKKIEENFGLIVQNYIKK